MSFRIGSVLVSEKADEQRDPSLALLQQAPCVSQAGKQASRLRRLDAQRWQGGAWMRACGACPSLISSHAVGAFLLKSVLVLMELLLV